MKKVAANLKSCELAIGDWRLANASRWVMLFALNFAPGTALAQDEVEKSASFSSAREAVRAGNQLLRAGKADEALKAYEQAKFLEPAALEIPFVQGLGQYQRQDFDSARELWSRASLSDDASLADAATYSLGTTYHAEALKQHEKPEEATKSLEQAMERYQQVLSHDGQHVAARDSLRKAAALRRQIKQMMQQQQEQQPNQEKSDEEKQEQSEQEQSSENSKQGEKESEESKEQQSQEQSEEQKQESSPQEQKEQQDQSAQSESAEQEQKESSAAQEKQEPSDPSDAKESQEQSEEAPAEPPEEDSSREQAERQLREMMQSLRDRQKQRKPPAQRVPIKPAEKDW